MTPCTLSTEVYRWQHNGGWKTGRLVMRDEFVLSDWGGLMTRELLHTGTRILVFDALAEAPGLSFVPWGEMEIYERGE